MASTSVPDCQSADLSICISTGNICDQMQACYLCTTYTTYTFSQEAVIVVSTPQCQADTYKILLFVLIPVLFFAFLFCAYLSLLKWKQSSHYEAVQQAADERAEQQTAQRRAERAAAAAAAAAAAPPRPPPTILERRYLPCPHCNEMQVVPITDRPVRIQCGSCNERFRLSDIPEEIQRIAMRATEGLAQPTPPTQSIRPSLLMGASNAGIAIDSGGATTQSTRSLVNSSSEPIEMKVNNDVPLSSIMISVNRNSRVGASDDGPSSQRSRDGTMQENPLHAALGSSPN